MKILHTKTLEMQLERLLEKWRSLNAYIKKEESLIQ